MKASNTKDIPLLVLKRIGFYSETKSKKTFIMPTLVFLILLYIDIIALAQLPYIKNIPQFADHVFIINAFGQSVGTVTLFAKKREKLHKILLDTKRFWKSSICSNEDKIKLDIFAHNIIRFQKLYLNMAIVCIVVFSFGMLTGRSLPLGEWLIPGHDSLHKSTIVIQLLGCQSIAIFQCSFDSLFFGLAAEVVIQFRILCYCLKKLKVRDITSNVTQDEYHRKLILYIQHHAFLLRFLESLRDYFSTALLVIYLTISPIVCVTMYMVLEGTSVQLIVKHLILFITVVGHLGYICVAAHMVSSEALTVADAIYDSDWYSKHIPALRHSVTFVIQKSQQDFSFTARGLVELNLRTLVVVLRASYSAYTIMSGLKK